MSFEHRERTPDEIVGKVLRRAEVAKMARTLQDRLALASYKTQHGQEALSFNDVEARLERAIQRKRAHSSIGASSSTSSSSSDQPLLSGGIASSPLSAPFSSDGIHSSANTNTSRKRDAYEITAMDAPSRTSKRPRSRSTMPADLENLNPPWKSAHNLSESSPAYHHSGQFATSNGPNISFASEASVITPSPAFEQISTDESNDIPSHSFSMDPAFQSSPPQTPPPNRSRAMRHRRNKQAGEEGADLLLYLAGSPSSSNPPNKSSQISGPSTPPPNAALPSSLMGASGFAGFTTPGQQFNFADFVNITPSPAQGAFGNRTPGLAKTPVAAKEARRRLNFDALVPPGGSPNISDIGRGSVGKESGLGMELGGELVS